MVNSLRELGSVYEPFKIFLLKKKDRGCKVNVEIWPYKYNNIFMNMDKLRLFICSHLDYWFFHKDIDFNNY